MDIDKRDIMNKLSAISDDELKNIVRAVARSAGVSQSRTERVVADVGKLRTGLSGMTEKDFNDALSLVDSETADSIKKQMGL
jgi:precorrin isomerase